MLAPEQALNQRRLFTTRIDVFALGAVAYHLLVGGGPHPTSASAQQDIRTTAIAQPRDPVELDPTVPEPIRRALLKACARHPLARFAQARHFARALREWAASQ